ncbi:MAG: HAD family hydrolase [Chloroflexi bacterium]|nr:MAG: HAD family hydrolase [Chloroflexota bacterium]
MDSEMTQETKDIKLIVVDLDGTLLNDNHQLSERNERALKDAISQGVQVVIATGKTFTSARTIIEKLDLKTPGIYVQGLTIYQPDGTLIWQQTLPADVCRRVITFAEDRGFTVVAYAGTRILCRELADGIEQLAEKYHEPMPEGVGPLQNILFDLNINKLMIVKQNNPKKITALRWLLKRQLDGQGRLVQAMLKDMVEVLPPNTSKGSALKHLLKTLGVEAENVLAIGDGENDIEMIQLAGVGVAVANADERLKSVADHVVASNQDDGVAEAVERFVLKSTETAPQTTEETKIEDEAAKPE